MTEALASLAGVLIIGWLLSVEVWVVAVVAVGILPWWSPGNPPPGRLARGFVIRSPYVLVTISADAVRVVHRMPALVARLLRDTSMATGTQAARPGAHRGCLLSDPRDLTRAGPNLSRDAPANRTRRRSNQRYFGPNTSMATRPALTAQGQPA
jgi:hypothetical protein